MINNKDYFTNQQNKKEEQNKVSDNEKRKVQLKYPCLWVYKIIGLDANDMQCAVAEIIRDRTYKISHSRSSTTEKYHCLNVELLVESESHRIAMYKALKTHPTIKVVL